MIVQKTLQQIIKKKNSSQEGEKNAPLLNSGPGRGRGRSARPGAPSSFTPRILQTPGGSRLLISSSSSPSLWPKRLLPGADPAAASECVDVCVHTQTQTHTHHPPTPTHTEALGPQNNQARMAFSPGDAAENAQVAIRTTRVSANFCPFILGFGKKGAQNG